ncbi:MAG TPA: peptide chain release factor N(5)-glutamine methyltransferase, partial [Planctomycetaceae bacterium]|nr:peptide chain release factor N(5)-glutamine methyltransferase [Planctomycetaceae bacterium]
MSSESDVWTVGKLLEWTTNYLQDNGSDSARLDAEVLLANAMQCQRVALYTHFDSDPGDQVRASFRIAVKQRSEGRPVAYMVGFKEFYSMQYTVNDSVLIPRPATEDLVIRILDLVKEQHHPDDVLKIVDVGTGSGIIAGTLATQLKRSVLFATDLSAEAIDVASDNFQNHSIGERVTTRQGDLLDAVSDQDSFDFVVSNPPYVSEAEYEALQREVKDYEPRMALVPGPTGLEIYERLIPQAAEKLKPGGWLVLETSPMLASELAQLITNHGEF